MTRRRARIESVETALDHLRACLAAATDEERARLVRSLVAPGGIVLGETIQMQLRIPAPIQRAVVGLASDSACSTKPIKCLELRIVA